MKRVKALDCTLRDGGYCNEWRFGFSNISKIVNGLAEANVEIIECGFITSKIQYDINATRFTSVYQVSNAFPKHSDQLIRVCMINYGEYSADELPEYSYGLIEGIRVAFHKRDLIPAIRLCQDIQKKGYKVFVQPMVSLNYSDEEFLALINKINSFKPYAFYIVDSFGSMKRHDLMRLYSLVEHNLHDSVLIGFHSHNNMQLSYSNAQALIEHQSKRKLIIDSSIFGMGRGAGNLNTELLLGYLNEHTDSSYNLRPLFSLIDDTIIGFYQKKYWGYSLPNYLSAKHNLHPNYADYLDSRQTMTVENMDELFSVIDEDKKVSFDREYIERLYEKYMETGKSQYEHLEELKCALCDKDVLIIAPGRSIVEEKEKIIEFASLDTTIVISINRESSFIKEDYLFMSNLRRYRESDKSVKSKSIVTSNIPSVDAYLKVSYKSLLNDNEPVKDNAGMMLIKLLIDLGVKNVYLAGMDGYSADSIKNYANPEMTYYMQRSVAESINHGMNEVLKEYRKKIRIKFLTTPKYITI